MKRLFLILPIVIISCTYILQADIFRDTVRAPCIFDFISFIIYEKSKPMITEYNDLTIVDSSSTECAKQLNEIGISPYSYLDYPVDSNKFVMIMDSVLNIINICDDAPVSVEVSVSIYVKGINKDYFLKQDKQIRALIKLLKTNINTGGCIESEYDQYSQHPYIKQ